MGMDVFGIKPKIKEGSFKPDHIDWSSSTEEEKDKYMSDLNNYYKDNPGVYFRANVWSWRPIHDLICTFSDNHQTETGEPLFTERELVSMGMNEGAGAKTQQTCNELARRFDIWLEHNASGRSLDLGMEIISGSGQFASKEDIENPDVKTESAYRTSDSHIKEFVEFLRGCGGFEVH